MSLNSVLRTGVSGMNAQANKLGTVADNIANTSTTGYKRSSVEFASLVLGSAGGDYDSGAVQTSVIRAVDTAGSMRFTKSTTDLAIDGAGFFLVADDAGTTYLTRAGPSCRTPPASSSTPPATSSSARRRPGRSRPTAPPVSSRWR